MCKENKDRNMETLAEKLSKDLFEVKKKNAALSTKVVYEALRYYHKQGLAETDNKYEDLIKALNALQ